MTGHRAELATTTPPAGLLTHAHLETLADDERVRQLAKAFCLGRASAQTQRSYRVSLDLWLAYCTRFGLKPLVDPLGVHVEGWIKTLEAEGAKPSTINSRVSAMSSWYGWLIRDQHANRNPASGVKRPGVSQAESVTIGLDRTQAQALLAAAKADTHSQTHVLRNVAIITWLLNNAFRCGDIIGMNDNDLGQSRGHRTIQVRGKGQTVHTIPLAPTSIAALEEYLAGRDPAPGPLFQTESGGRLDHKALFRVVRRCARLAAKMFPDIGMDLISKRISPHSLRHTAITAALDAGVSLRDVQDYARHADPKTTRRYDQNRHSLDRHATYAVATYLAED